MWKARTPARYSHGTCSARNPPPAIMRSATRRSAEARAMRSSGRAQLLAAIRCQHLVKPMQAKQLRPCFVRLQAVINSAVESPTLTPSVNSMTVSTSTPVASSRNPSTGPSAPRSRYALAKRSISSRRRGSARNPPSRRSMGRTGMWTALRYVPIIRGWAPSHRHPSCRPTRCDRRLPPLPA